jgi:hypothetical protein
MVASIYLSLLTVDFEVHFLTLSEALSILLNITILFYLGESTSVQNAVVFGFKSSDCKHSTITRYSSLICGLAAALWMKNCLVKDYNPFTVLLSLQDIQNLS